MTLIVIGLAIALLVVWIVLRRAAYKRQEKAKFARARYWQSVNYKAQDIYRKSSDATSIYQTDKAERDIATLKAAHPDLPEMNRTYVDIEFWIEHRRRQLQREDADYLTDAERAWARSILGVDDSVMPAAVERAYDRFAKRYNLNRFNADDVPEDAVKTAEKRLAEAAEARLLLLGAIEYANR